MNKYIVYTNQRYELSHWRLITEEFYRLGELYYIADGLVYSQSSIDKSNGSYRVDYKLANASGNELAYF